MALRRYLIRHYFENTETSYTAIEEFETLELVVNKCEALEAPVKF